MSTVESFRTLHLVADRIRSTDFDLLHQMHQDGEVMATLTIDGGTLPAAETRQHLARYLDHWERHSWGLWLFRDQADGQFVGRAGLQHVLVEDVAGVELAYAVMPTYWGQGLATEMATAILEVGFEQLGLNEIVAFTLVSNHASQRVMQKAGFSYERDVVKATLPHVLYRITANQWRRQQPSPNP